MSQLWVHSLTWDPLHRCNVGHAVIHVHCATLAKLCHIMLHMGCRNVVQRRVTRGFAYHRYLPSTKHLAQAIRPVVSPTNNNNNNNAPCTRVNAPLGGCCDSAVTVLCYPSRDEDSLMALWTGGMPEKSAEYVGSAFQRTLATLCFKLVGWMEHNKSFAT